MRLLFVGPPGAGKGTQAEQVAGALDIAHISTGDMFRALDPSTPLGRRVKEIMESGEYVPDEVVVEMLEDRMSEPDAEKGFILDGFPRTAGQVSALDQLLGEDGLDRVVVLEVDEEQLVQRMMSRGRADDSEETIRTRLRVYREQTAPLIEEYERRGKVVRVDGVGGIDEVTRRILDIVDT